MGFASPPALLLLFAALPLIVFLHSLRPRRLRVRTTALFLWEKARRRRPIGSRLGRFLKRNLLLLLQILVATLLVLSLARPFATISGAPSGDLIVVVDLSASMQAKGRAGRRFNEAREALVALIDRLRSGESMMVIGAGPSPRVLSPFTRDKRALKSLARRLEPTEAPGAVREATLFAHTFFKRRGQDRIVLISDGAFAGAEELPWDSPHLSLVRVAGGDANVGITGFEARRLQNDPSAFEFMVRVQNFMSRPARVPVALSLGDRKLVEEILDLAPEERHVAIVPYHGALGGLAEARLAVEDDFAIDNRALLVLSEASRLHLLYVGRGNPFLARLFRFLPYLEVTHVESWSGDPAAGGENRYDVILFDGVPAPPLKEGNFILINTVPDGLPLVARGAVKNPRPRPLAQDHPLLAGVRLDAFSVATALRLSSRGGVDLVGSDAGPLVFAYESGRLRALLFAFDLAASDLPYRVAFPVLFANALNWFHPRQAEFPTVKVRAGDPYPVYLPAGDDRLEVVKPSGRSEELSLAVFPYLYAETFENGIYRFKSKSREVDLAVNLVSESESRIAPRIRSPASASAAAADGRGADRSTPLWPYLAILALIGLAIEGFLVLRHGAPLLPLAGRVLAAAAVVAALVNPRLFRAAEALDVVFAVDLSRSVGERAKEIGLDLIERAHRVKAEGTRLGLIFFGRNAVWEFPPSAGVVPLGEIAAEVGREETDIQIALQAAMAEIGEGREGKILLVTDGNENRGEAARVAHLLRAQGIGLSAFPVDVASGRNEIYLSRLDLPREVASLETFEIKAAVESLRPARARVRLLLDGNVERDESVSLLPGTNWLRFPQRLSGAGSRLFEILVDSPDDALAENNLLQGVVRIKGPPRVLHILGRDDGRFVSQALSAQGYSVAEVVRPSLSLPQLAAYDLVVLNDVPAYHLSQAQMEALESYARDLGGGVLVLGGDQSYGAGGYYRTPIARLLPVEMRPPSRFDLPHVALLFVLDKSGSMAAGPEGATKLDLAKAAVAAAVDLLNPKDQVGLLAFDADWRWTVPFRQVGRAAWLSEKLEALKADGGTDLYKAVIEALRGIADQPASVRHLLVLSDGLTDERDFAAVVAKAAERGITVSTIAVGQDADVGLLRAIARRGRGRSYVTVDPRTIPQVFTTEALLVTRELIVEKQATPRVVSSAASLKGFAGRELPPIHGYVLTHPKANAQELMKVADAPLLVSWRYGLGNVVAYTSDLGRRWGRDWLTWSDFQRWLGQVARGAVKRNGDERVRVELNPEAEEITVTLDLLSPAGDFVNRVDLSGNLKAGDQSPVVRPLEQSAPGRYEGRFPLSRGLHFLTLYREAKQGSEAAVVDTVSFVTPYPREYRHLRANLSLLSRLAEEGGGELIEPEKLDEGLKRLLTPDPKKGRAASETWWPLSGAALLLFLADLASRRLPRYRDGDVGRTAGSA